MPQVCSVFVTAAFAPRAYLLVPPPAFVPTCRLHSSLQPRTSRTVLRVLSGSVRLHYLSVLFLQFAHCCSVRRSTRRAFAAFCLRANAHATRLDGFRTASTHTRRFPLPISSFYLLLPTYPALLLYTIQLVLTVRCYTTPVQPTDACCYHACTLRLRIAPRIQKKKEKTGAHLRLHTAAHTVGTLHLLLTFPILVTWLDCSFCSSCLLPVINAVLRPCGVRL